MELSGFVRGPEMTSGAVLVVRYGLGLDTCSSVVTLYLIVRFGLGLDACSSVVTLYLIVRFGLGLDARFSVVDSVAV
jgi:hypothetical protein